MVVSCLRKYAFYIAYCLAFSKNDLMCFCFQILFAVGISVGAAGSAIVSTVDRYNYLTGIWDSIVMPSSRKLMAAVSIGNLAFFAGY